MTAGARQGCGNVETNACIAEDKGTVAAVLALVLLLLLFFGSSTLAALAGLYARDPGLAHGVLMPWVALWAAWQRRHDVTRRVAGRRLPGLFLVAAGVVVMEFGNWYAIALCPGYKGHVFLRGLGLIVAALGVLTVGVGWGRTRILLPALAVLLFGLPIPESLMMRITLPLRGISVLGSHALLRALGLAVSREGNILHLANGSLGIAEACSGIRSTWALAAATGCLAVMCRTRVGRAALLLIAVPCLTVAANVVRLTVSGLLVAWEYPGLTKGTPHEILGICTFLLSVAGMALLASPRRRIGQTEAGRKLREMSDGTPASCGRGASILRRKRAAAVTGAVVLLSIGWGAEWGLRRHYEVLYAAGEPPRVKRRLLADLPMHIGRFRRLGDGALPDVDMHALSPDDALIAQYIGENGQPVLLNVFYWKPRLITPDDDYRRDVKIPHNPDHCFPGAGWERMTTSDAALPCPWETNNVLFVRFYVKGNVARVVLFANQYGYPGGRRFVPEDVLDRLAALWKSLRVPPTAVAGERYSVIVAADASRSATVARRTALRFAQALAPLLPEYGIGPVPFGHSGSVHCGKN